MAIGVLREFQRASLRIPDDVALTGFEDIYPGRFLDPALTTVSQPIRELGTRAAERLLAKIAEPGLPPSAQMLPTTALFRASCGCRPEHDGRQLSQGLHKRAENHPSPPSREEKPPCTNLESG
jgi:LacI family transcriptional regulator